MKGFVWLLHVVDLQLVQLIAYCGVGRNGSWDVTNMRARGARVPARARARLRLSHSQLLYNFTVGVFFPWRAPAAAGAVSTHAPRWTSTTSPGPGASSYLKRASSPASPAHDRLVKKQAPRTRSRRGPRASAKQQHPQSQLLARHRPAGDSNCDTHRAAPVGRASSTRGTSSLALGGVGHRMVAGMCKRTDAGLRPAPLPPALWTWDLGCVKPARRPSIAASAQCCDQFPSGLCLGEAHHRSWRAWRTRHHGQPGSSRWRRGDLWVARQGRGTKAGTLLQRC